MSERRTLLLYSTCHISLVDKELLDKLAEDSANPPEWPQSNTCYVAGHDYGWLLWVGTEGPDRDAEAEFEAAGFSPAIPSILRHAHARGAEYVMLDCDAIEDEDLKTYDWQDEQRARGAQSLNVDADPSPADAR